MWRNLELTHFKCFEKLSLPMAPLTLLTGLNSSGKSSVIHALSLLSQTILGNEWGTDLMFNGEIVRLGAMGDVVNDVKGRHGFSIRLRDDNCVCEWQAFCENRQSLTAGIQQVTLELSGRMFDVNVKRDITEDQKKLAEVPVLHRLIAANWTMPEAAALVQRVRDLVFISAERIGPREVYEVFSDAASRKVGTHGERTAWVIYNFSEELISKSLCLDQAPPTLRRQVSAWLNVFFPGAEIEVIPVQGANLVLLRVRASAGSEFHRPQNVGFGLTHVLPILTACLAAKVGEVVLIENPESHLHPSGQSEMGRFLALVAKSGVQVVFETHSDHVLNGVRKAVAAEYLTPDQVAISYFKSEKNDLSQGQAVSVSIPIDKAGRIAFWPNGFFDQIEKDLDDIFGNQDAGVSK